MAEELKELIEKIHREGIQAAQNKAAEIEAQAHQKANRIIQEAGSKAKALIDEAQKENAKRAQETRDLLKQAGRDFTLSLRKEIHSMLQAFVLGRIREALKPVELAKILSSLIKGYDKEMPSITVSLKKEDLDALGAGFLDEFKDSLKEGIILRPSEDITGGFIISYDAGKSYFDFTDKALAEYIVSQLKPKLADILKDKT